MDLFLYSVVNVSFGGSLDNLICINVGDYEAATIPPDRDHSLEAAGGHADV
jgi:hypothetical protein